MSQSELGPALGWSHRTAVRWESGRSSPTPGALVKLASLVLQKDVELAAEVAAAAGQTLESLGLVAAPAPQPAPAPRVSVDVLADAVVCAAADVTDLSSRTLRPILHAAVARARALDLTLDELEESLRVRIGAKPSARKTSEQARVRVAKVDATDEAPVPPRSTRSAARG
jgi:hypothetical protein